MNRWLLDAGFEGGLIVGAGQQTAGRDQGSRRFTLKIMGDVALVDMASGKNLLPRSRKARAIVAYLALAGSDPIKRERLAAILWSDRANEQARASLRQAITDLRDLTVGDRQVLVIDREEVSLRRDVLALDRDDFEHLAATGDLSGLDAALAHWDGVVLAGLDGLDTAFDDWLSTVRGATETTLMAAALDAVEGKLTPGDAPLVATIATRLLTIDPFSERAARLGLRASAEAGDAAEMHRRYRQFETRLRKELGAAPSEATRGLFRDLARPGMHESTAARTPDAAFSQAQASQPRLPDTQFSRIPVEPERLASDSFNIVRFQARFVGAFALEDAQGQNVLPTLRKTRALLARILLAHGEALSRSTLIEFAWRDREVEQGRASFRQALYEARTLTQGGQPLILAGLTTVRANPAILDSDFDRLIAAAGRDDIHALASALGPDLPPLLSDLDGITPTIDAWLAAVRQEKQAELCKAVGAAVGRALDSGRTSDRRSLLAFLEAADPAHASVASHGRTARQTDPSFAGPAGHGRLRRAGLLTGAAVLLLSAALAAAWWVRPATPHRVLVVEPMKAAAGDAPAQTVRLGLAGDLTHALVGNPARLSVGQIGQPGVRAADADLIVSGDVATLGGRLQAHVQLANAHGGAILWANDFSGDPGHPDVVREQIATKADSVINCALSTRHRGAARIGDEANRLYLKACDLIEQFRLDEALPPLRQVTILEPGFARAWADLATTQAFTADHSDPTREAAAYREAAANARRALAIDPQTGLAYYALANTMPGIVNWRRRVETVARGLSVEPDGSELNNAMGKELLQVGRSREAITYFRRSMASDPLNPVKTATLFRALAFDGQLDEAEGLIDRALRLWPRNSLIWDIAFTVELRAGDPQRAEAMLDAPDRLGLRDAKQAEQARRWLQARRDPIARNIAAAMAPMFDKPTGDSGEDILPAALRIAELGQTDEAYRMALSATGDMDEDNDQLLFREGLSRFREDPRFMELAARRGLLHIWQATGAWPDFCLASHRQGCGKSEPTGPAATPSSP